MMTESLIPEPQTLKWQVYCLTAILVNNVGTAFGIMIACIFDSLAVLSLSLFLPICLSYTYALCLYVSCFSFSLSLFLSLMPSSCPSRLYR